MCWRNSFCWHLKASWWKFREVSSYDGGAGVMNFGQPYVNRSSNAVTS